MTLQPLGYLDACCIMRLAVVSVVSIIVDLQPCTSVRPSFDRGPWA